MAGLKVGLFGGTFDPPHLGHRTLALAALNDLSLHRLLWILTASPPHKHNRQITPLAHRLAMLQLAIQDEPRFFLSRVEIDRPPPHYAVETLRILREQMPGDQFFYLMGGDSLRDLVTWYDSQGFISQIDGLVVMRRPGVDLPLAEIERSLPGLASKMIFLDLPLVDISSSEIRRLARAGLPFAAFLQPEVYHFIQAHGLYGQAPG
jgi:nicotinate-nucleotide adenylyltransferase